MSPKKFLQYITLNELKNNISKTKSIQELSETVGLSSQSRVYDLFVNIESVTPNEYKTSGLGINIDYGIHSSPFGLCLIANTKKGICAIEFINNNEEEVIDQFKQQWSNATIQRSDENTSYLISLIFNNENKPIKALLFGTQFQIKVWEALLKIPFGQLSTYSDMAQWVDNPKASRAVGTAIGKNNLAYLIPCHRVVRQLGGLGGYKWGEDRKLSMIGWEASKIRDTNELKE